MSGQHESMELTMAKQKISNLETAAINKSSATLNLLITLQVFLEEDELDGALALIKEYTE